MRAAALAALVALALVVAGCGSSAASIGSAATQGPLALVPADADAYASIDLKKDFPGRTLLLGSFASDVGALGNEIDIAHVGKDVLAIAKPNDESKFRTLAQKHHLVVQKIDDWTVAASSQAMLDRARAARNGSSLASNGAFHSAWDKLDTNSVARVWSPKNGLVGTARADGNALSISATTHTTRTVSVASSPLLGDVPSGAALAVAFHGAGSTAMLKEAGLAQLAPLLQGDGVLYVRPAGLLPQIAIELASPNPEATLTKVRELLQKYRSALGPIQLTATMSAGKVVIADGPAAVAALRGGSKLVDDGAYKDAVKAAGAPAQTAVFAYADVTALAPFVELAAQATQGKPLGPSLTANLEKVGTVVAWGTQSADTLHLGAWLRPR